MAEEVPSTKVEGGEERKKGERRCHLKADRELEELREEVPEKVEEEEGEEKRV